MGIDAPYERFPTPAGLLCIPGADLLSGSHVRPCHCLGPRLAKKQAPRLTGSLTGKNICTSETGSQQNLKGRGFAY